MPMIVVVMRVMMPMIVIVIVVMVIIVMMVVTMLLRVRSLDRPAVLEDAEAGARESAALGLAALDRDPREAEPDHHVRKHLGGHPQIQAGAEEHVPGDAAAAIQVVGRHGRQGYHAPPALSFSETQRPRWPRITWSTSRTPTISAASPILCVKRMSSALGDGSPLGWVWKR